MLLADLDLPDFRAYAVDVPRPATEHQESTRRLGELLRDLFVRNASQSNFRLFFPDELQSLTQQAVAYTRNHLEDPPEIRDWTWPSA